MQKLYKKTFGLVFSALFLGLLMAPTAFAIECDDDGDKYISITYNQMQEVVLDNLEYRPDGNYQPDEWASLIKESRKLLRSRNSLNMLKGKQRFAL